MQCFQIFLHGPQIMATTAEVSCISNHEQRIVWFQFPNFSSWIEIFFLFVGLFLIAAYTEHILANTEILQCTKMQRKPIYLVTWIYILDETDADHLRQNTFVIRADYANSKKIRGFFKYFTKLYLKPLSLSLSLGMVDFPTGFWRKINRHFIRRATHLFQSPLRNCRFCILSVSWTWQWRRSVQNTQRRRTKCFLSDFYSWGQTCCMCFLSR